MYLALVSSEYAKGLTDATVAEKYVLWFAELELLNVFFQNVTV